VGDACILLVEEVFRIALFANIDTTLAALNSSIERNLAAIFGLDSFIHYGSKRLAVGLFPRSSSPRVSRYLINK